MALRPSRSSVRLIACLVMVVVAVACRGKAQTATPAAVGVEPAAEARAGVPAAGMPLVVLLEPGKEPRRALRYAVPSSAREELAMAMTSASRVVAPGHEWSTEPPVRLAMDLGAAGKPRGRELAYRFEITDIQTGNDRWFEARPGELAGQFEAALGTAGTVLVDDRGFNRKVELSLPAGIEEPVRRALETSRQALQQMSISLPEEPVGIGARWRVEQLLVAEGLELEQKILYELVELDGQRGLLASTIEQTADPQLAGMVDADVRVEILSHAGAGAATIEFDLARRVPVESTATLETETSLRFVGGDWDHTAIHVVKRDSRVEIRRR